MNLGKRPLRFGKAVARVRTSYLKQHRRLARQFIEQAVQSVQSGKSGLNFNPRQNKFWMDHANLEPVLSFLAEK